eukprot:m.498258 g.498258  ORF g.498258 m.498258 type:complete len:127 (-) comp21822_c0_seq12:2448-2828(-)
MWLLPSVFLSQGAGVGQMDNGAVDVPVDCLPSGRNSFFRQLDHIIATVASVEFSRLYEATRAEIGAGLRGAVSSDAIAKYTKLKAAIFARYRTISEILGILVAFLSWHHRCTQQCGLDVPIMAISN